MNENDTAICTRAVEILRRTEYGQPHHAFCYAFAEAVESHLVAGYPEYDEKILSLCKKIIEKSLPELRRELDDLERLLRETTQSPIEERQIRLRIAEIRQEIDRINQESMAVAGYETGMQTRASLGI